MNDLLSLQPAFPEGHAHTVDPAQQLWLQWRQGRPPSLDDLVARTRELPPAELIAVLQVDQRERWHRGERIVVEDYLKISPALASQDEALLDLLYSEMIVREEVDDSVPVDEYVRRFPHLGPQLRRQRDLHDALDADALEECDVTTLYRGPRHGPTGATGRPERIGKYLIIGALDEGGQGAVYRAVHPALGKEVALKWGRHPVSDKPGQRDLLLAEGRILAELDHPSLARVYDMDVFQDRPFVVLEYVPGRNLEQFARQEAPDPRRAAAIIAQVAGAVAVAHRRGIVHRDIKPRNILIDEAGRPRLIDFGLARLQHAWGEDPAEFGHLLGTVQYMAPEQALTLHVDVGPRSDIFALGGVLYFLLAGRPPFQAVSFEATLEQAQRGDWDRNALSAARAPRRLEAICCKALAKNPEDRYARAEDLAADLAAFAKPRRWPIRAMAGAAVLVFAFIGLIGWRGDWWGRPPETASSPPQRGLQAQPAQPFQSSLAVRVWRKRHFIDLGDAVPLRPRDEVKVQLEVPAGHHASLFLFTSEGKLRRLSVASPRKTSQVLHFPERGDQAVPLTGPPGTEMLLVVASPSGPVEEKTVAGLWSGEGSWAALPGGTILRVEPARVRVEHAERGFGPARSRADPEGQMRRRLEELRLRLRERYEHFEGLVFSH